jgi:hypothetical protein
VERRSLRKTQGTRHGIVYFRMCVSREGNQMGEKKILEGGGGMPRCRSLPCGPPFCVCGSSGGPFFAPVRLSVTARGALGSKRG